MNEKFQSAIWKYAPHFLLGITTLVWLYLSRTNDLLVSPILDEIFFFPTLHGYGVFVATLVVIVLLMALYLGVVLLNARKRQLKPLAVWYFLVLICIVCIFTSPIGARDMINYLLELKLIFHYGQNPYITTPQNYSFDPFFKVSNVTSIPLYYGPAWIAISSLPVVLMDFSNIFTAIVVHKLFSVGLLFASCIVLYRMHPHRNSKLSQVLFFGLNPLILFETVVNGHNDILIFLLVLLAYVLRNKSIFISSFLLGISILIKYYTVFLIPLFLLYYVKRKNRTSLVTFMLGMGLNVIFVMPFWAQGKFIMGAINGVYLSQLAFYNTSLLSLSRELGGELPVFPGVSLMPVLILAVFSLLSVFLYFRYWKNRVSLLWAIVIQLALILIFVSLLYPWYLIPLIGFLVVLNTRVSRVLIVSVSSAAFFYYFTFGLLSLAGMPNLTLAHIIQFCTVILAILVPILYFREKLNLSGPEET